MKVNMKFGDRVEVTNGHGLSVNKYQQGYFIGRDAFRSVAGFQVFVVWDEELGGHHRGTWIPDQCLKLVEEN